MLKRLIPLFVLLTSLLVACQGAAVTPEPFSTAGPAPSQAPVEGTQSESGERSPDTFAVNGNPTPGATQESIFAPVGEADWVLGSDTADITIIEYSDFQ